VFLNVSLVDTIYPITILNLQRNSPFTRCLYSIFYRDNSYSAFSPPIRQFQFEVTAAMGNVSSRDIIFAIAICYTIHPAVNFTAIMLPARAENDDHVGRCDIDVLESTPEIPDCAFPFLGKRASGSFHFNSRNVKKNRLTSIPRSCALTRALENAYRTRIPLTPRFYPRFSARLFSHGVSAIFTRVSRSSLDISRSVRRTIAVRGEKHGAINDQSGIRRNRD